MNTLLIRRLSDIIAARHQLRQRRAVTWLIIVLALGFGIALLTPEAQAHYTRLMLIAGGTFASGWLLIRGLVRPERFDPQKLARDVESKHPELQALLLTAVEQHAGEQGLGYMQQRVLDEATRVASRHLWGEELTAAPRLRVTMWRLAALLLFLGTFSSFVWQHLHHRRALPNIAQQPTKADAPAQAFQIEVTPGDVEVERGARLVVEARFPQSIPEQATLVLLNKDGTERSRLPMKSTVDSHVFGGLASGVKEDGRYRVEYEGRQSKEYAITTFIHPELVQSDATVTPPAYTGQPAREIKNTLKVSALEGSQVGLSLKINKPVAQAELFADKDHIIPLKPSAKDPTVLETAWQPDATRKYRLHLVDDKERGNKTPPWFSITVLANALPKIEIAFPKRDAKVSMLQEMPLEARLWDDLGVRKAGAVVELPNAKREIALPVEGSPAGKKFDVKTLLNLEKEALQPMQLVSYYFWAEDQGPKGETRRTMSDMFFAEVREFEDIYRESEPPPPSEGGEEKEGKTDELVKLQKDIVNANWRLIRDQQGGRAMPLMKQDVDTVLVSQSIAQEKLDGVLEKVKDPRVKAPLLEAQKQMKLASQTLGPASDKADAKALTDALTPEQSALRFLYQAQNNEHNVTKANPKSKSKGKSQQQQQELSDLELKQKDQRYEEDKKASDEKTAEQQENLAVLNRLKELARRQEALAEKMKQLEQQLAQAKTEDQKEQLADQLKRLQDEQEQLLRDVDDLKERMEKPENAQQMADAKKQLDDTREKVSDASEKLKNEQLAQAAAAASRAQKSLEQARDDFRQRTARRFSEEMKGLRDEARQLAQEQQKLEDQMEGRQPKAGKDGSEPTTDLKSQLSGLEASRRIDEQRQRATKLMDDVKRVSEQAEESEPLLHRHLYEAARSATTQGLDENLAEASMQNRYGNRTAAQDASHKATKAVDSLKQGVEKAAESVLGNESEALRMARTELDKLIQQAKQDETRANGGKPVDKDGKGNDEARMRNDEVAQAGDGKGKDGQQGKQPGEPLDQAKDGKGKDGQQGKQPGEPSDQAKDGKGMAQAGDKPGKEGQGKQPGEGKGEGEQPDKADAANPQGKGMAQAGDKAGKDGKGQQPGEGKDQGEQPNKFESGNKDGKGMAQAGDKEGQGEGKEDGQDGQPGEGKGQGQGQKPGQQTAQGKDGKGQQGKDGQGSEAGGDQQGQGQGQGKGQMASAQEGQQGRDGSQRGGNRNQGGANNAGGGGGGNNYNGGGGGDWFFDGNREVTDESAITGDRFEQWADRLRGLEEMLNRPELRNDASRVLDQARAMRIESRRNNTAPEATTLRQRITQPLVELRDRVNEELARRDGNHPLAPLDRDPVPEAYRELVQKYYEQLGSGR